MYCRSYLYFYCAHTCIHVYVQYIILSDTHTGSLKGDYVGYDWFVATMFLVMKGSVNQTVSFLEAFAHLLSSGYLWIPRLHLSVSEKHYNTTCSCRTYSVLYV